jgi:hypothetical protein
MQPAGMGVVRFSHPLSHAGALDRPVDRPGFFSLVALLVVLEVADWQEQVQRPNPVVPRYLCWPYSQSVYIDSSIIKSATGQCYP